MKERVEVITDEDITPPAIAGILVGLDGQPFIPNEVSNSIKKQINKIYEQLESENLDSETRKLLLNKAFELSQTQLKNERY